MGRDWWILITAATKLQLRNLSRVVVWLDNSVKHVSLGTPALGVKEESRHRGFLCTHGHASLSVYCKRLKLREIKCTGEEERMESLERPTLRSKVWKSWNILSPETCDREGGGRVSLMIRTQCNYRATPLTVIDQWGTPLMKTRTHWLPGAKLAKSERWELKS